MKSVKADRKLIQRLLNAVTAGRPVKMDSIMKHELSTVPLSIAKVGGDMHSTSKAELIDILKGQINIPSELPETDMKTCVLIDGHALIKALGKPNGCQTFGECMYLCAHFILSGLQLICTCVCVTNFAHVDCSAKHWMFNVPLNCI